MVNMITKPIIATCSHNELQLATTVIYVYKAVPFEAEVVLKCVLTMCGVLFVMMGGTPLMLVLSASS